MVILNNKKFLLIAAGGLLVAAIYAGLVLAQPEQIGYIGLATLLLFWASLVCITITQLSKNRLFLLLQQFSLLVALCLGTAHGLAGLLRIVGGIEGLVVLSPLAQLAILFGVITLALFVYLVWLNLSSAKLSVLGYCFYLVVVVIVSIHFLLIGDSFAKLDNVIARFVMGFFSLLFFFWVLLWTKGYTWLQIHTRIVLAGVACISVFVVLTSLPTLNSFNVHYAKKAGHLTGQRYQASLSYNQIELGVPANIAISIIDTQNGQRVGSDIKIAAVLVNSRLSYLQKLNISPDQEGAFKAQVLLSDKEAYVLFVLVANQPIYQQFNLYPTADSPFLAPTKDSSQQLFRATQLFDLASGSRIKLWGANLAFGNDAPYEVFLIDQDTYKFFYGSSASEGNEVTISINEPAVIGGDYTAFFLPVSGEPITTGSLVWD